MILSWSLDQLTLMDPWFLLVAPVLLVAVTLRVVRPRAALPTAAVSLFADLPRTLRQRLAWLPLALKAFAGLFLVLALARPVEREIVPLRDEGIDILLIVDTSSSMNTSDMRAGEPFRRIDAARVRAMECAAARVHDRVGVVAFARFAELRCPPTLDEEALAAFLRVIDTVPEGSEYDATAIGTALAKGVQILGTSDAKSRVVVLLSDGENSRPDLVAQVLPEEAAKLAKDEDVRVHTIGLGSGQPTALGRRKLEFRALQQIAETTGGQFFRPESDEELLDVYARIDELEKVERSDPRYRYADRFELPLAIGLALLVLAIAAETLWLRRLP